MSDESTVRILGTDPELVVSVTVGELEQLLDDGMDVEAGFLGIGGVAIHERTCHMSDGYCSVCGRPDPSGGDARYCAYCGARVVVPVVYPADKCRHVASEPPESIEDVRKAKDNAIAYLAQSGVMGWTDLNTFSSDFAQVFDRAYACGRRDGAGERV